MEIAIIGLGKMGGALASQALDKKFKVFGLTKEKAPQKLIAKGLIDAPNLHGLLEKMQSPKIIFLYLPAGPIIEKYIQKLSDILSHGDIVVDGGNSYWGDSVRRSKLLLNQGIHLLDMGTSGGISGAMEGACFMVGGNREAYETIEPFLQKMAMTNAYAYVGPSGSGHLVKLIHNGIEFGMLQAIGEGMALLEKFQEKIPLNLQEVFKVFRNGSVIRSWLIDLMNEQYNEARSFNKIPSYIEDTGEVNWLVSDALHLEVPIPVIGQSVMELFRSRDQQHIDYKSVSMMRHGFGGHPFGEEDMLKKERLEGRIDHTFPKDYLNSFQT